MTDAPQEVHTINLNTRRETREAELRAAIEAHEKQQALAQDALDAVKILVGQLKEIDSMIEETRMGRGDGTTADKM